MKPRSRSHKSLDSNRGPTATQSWRGRSLPRHHLALSNLEVDLRVGPLLALALNRHLLAVGQSFEVVAFRENKLNRPPGFRGGLEDDDRCFCVGWDHVDLA